MTKAGKRLAALAALVVAAGPALASGGNPPAAESRTTDLSGVTVTAPKKPDPLVDPTTQFVRQHLPEGTFSEQYPRFRDPVCVRVVGLPPEFGGFIAQRVIEVATEVHAPVARAEDCRPNVHVVFTTKPQALLSDIANRKDILLGFYWHAADLKQLATFREPIGAWYVTATRDQFGENRLEKHDPTDFLNPRAGRAGSRLSNGMSAELEHSLIIADADRVAGEKIDSVADYIAVVALARWRGLDRCNAMPTILNRMAQDCDKANAPEAATPQDIALLTGLYAVDPRGLGSQQRATIASAIRKANREDAAMSK